MGNQFFSTISIEDLMTTLKDVVREEIRAAKEIEVSEKLLSPKETCNLLKVTVPTLNSWTEKGLIQKHYLGSRVFYKYGEIMSAVNRVKRYTRQVA